METKDELSQYIVLHHLDWCPRKGNGRKACRCSRSWAATMLERMGFVPRYSED